MEEELVKNIFMEPFDNVQKALDEAFNLLGKGAKAIIMHLGGSTLPKL